jgi:glutaredoxin
MAQLVLYSTVGCHLCEEAQRVIFRALGVTVAETDIADDPYLLEHYGIRIPVLRRVDTGEEIGWPFGEAAVRTLAR